jgi:hypothetical protein
MLDDPLPLYRRLDNLYQLLLECSQHLHVEHNRSGHLYHRRMPRHASAPREMRYPPSTRVARAVRCRQAHIAVVWFRRYIPSLNQQLSTTTLPTTIQHIGGFEIHAIGAPGIFVNEYQKIKVPRIHSTAGQRRHPTVIRYWQQTHKHRSNTRTKYT